MRHLVTGGSGFLGALICQRLAARGEDVLALDVWEDRNRDPRVRFAPCDVRDRAAVERCMRGIDIVHHNAALVPLAKSGRDFWTVNVDGSRIVAEAAGRAKARAFVHMSSSAIFGAPPSVPITDRTPAGPIEIYGRAKWAGEQQVVAACAAAQTPLVVIRPRTILAPSRLGIFQILFEWIKDGRNVYVIGDGRVPFQFVHASDLMDAYFIALDRQQPGTYNVGTDRFGTLREALEHLVGYAGSASAVKALPIGLTINTLRLLDLAGLSPLAPWHYLTYHKAFHFDVAPLLELGWRPKYSNDEMLRESYDWFCQHGSPSGTSGRSPHRRRVREGILKVIRRFS